MFKGTNAIFPCRFCEMKAVKNECAARCPYYMTTLSPVGVNNPDYANLPLRTDATIKAKAYEIERTSIPRQRELLQKESGINGQVS